MIHDKVVYLVLRAVSDLLSDEDEGNMVVSFEVESVVNYVS